MLIMRRREVVCVSNEQWMLTTRVICRIVKERQIMLTNFLIKYFAGVFRGGVNLLTTYHCFVERHNSDWAYINQRKRDQS